MGDNMESKCALIVQGGGARGTYAAGALKVLLENDLYFDEVYGTSAGAILGAEFVTRDKERLKKLVVELSSAKGFVKVQNYFTKGSIFDFDYLFKELPKKKVPFKDEEFYNSKTTFYAVSSCVEDNKVAYFSQHDENFLKGIESSASLPPFCKPIKIGDKGYVDGGIFAAAPFEKAIEDNVPKIVVVATRAKGYRKKAPKRAYKALYKQQYRNNPVFLKSLLNAYKLYNEQMDLLDKLSEEGRIFVIYPSVPPTVKVTTQNKKKLQDLFEAAEKDTTNLMPALKEYLSK